MDAPALPAPTTNTSPRDKSKRAESTRSQLPRRCNTRRTAACGSAARKAALKIERASARRSLRVGIGRHPWNGIPCEQSSRGRIKHHKKQSGRNKVPPFAVFFERLCFARELRSQRI